MGKADAAVAILLMDPFLMPPKDHRNRPITTPNTYDGD